MRQFFPTVLVVLLLTSITFSWVTPLHADGRLKFGPEWFKGYEDFETGEDVAKEKRHQALLHNATCRMTCKNPNTGEKTKVSIQPSRITDGGFLLTSHLERVRACKPYGRIDRYEGCKENW